MVLQVSRVAMVDVKMLHDVFLLGPHIDIMLRVAEMISETTSKVSGPENQDF